VVSECASQKGLGPIETGEAESERSRASVAGTGSVNIAGHISTILIKRVLAQMSATLVMADNIGGL
jgi:hypothetical protein